MQNILSESATDRTSLVSGLLDGITINLVDLYPYILAVAKQKFTCQRCQDLNSGLGMLPQNYAGVVSTEPIALGHLLRLVVVKLLLYAGSRVCLYSPGIDAVHIMKFRKN